MFNPAKRKNGWFSVPFETIHSASLSMIFQSSACAESCEPVKLLWRVHAERGGGEGRGKVKRGKGEGGELFAWLLVCSGWSHPIYCSKIYGLIKFVTD